MYKYILEEKGIVLTFVHQCVRSLNTHEYVLQSSTKPLCIKQSAHTLLFHGYYIWHYLRSDFQAFVYFDSYWPKAKFKPRNGNF